MIELLDEGNKTKLDQHRRYFACPVISDLKKKKAETKSPHIISWINILFWAGIMLLVSFIFSA